MAFNEKYRVQENIGTGTYGTVYKCKRIDNKDGDKFAVKIIKVKGMKKKEKENLKRELNHLKEIKHVRIVEMFELFLIDDQISIVMEFCAGGTLKQYIERTRHVKENTCLRILQEMCEAVQFLYLKATIHRDIKPTNVLLTIDKNVKLADFGVAKLMDSPEMMNLTRLLGTPNYMSPEMVLEKPYDHKLDIWGIGICLYEMMTKKLLFEVDSLPELKEVMIKYEEPETSNLPYSKEIIQMLKLSLHKDSTQRPTPVEILLWITTFRQESENEYALRQEDTSAGNDSQQNNDASTRVSMENSQEQQSVHSRHGFHRDSYNPNTTGCATHLDLQSQPFSSSNETEDEKSETSGYESAKRNMTRRGRTSSPSKRNISSPSSHLRYFAGELGDKMADQMDDIVRQTLDMPEDEFLVILEQLAGTRIIDIYKKDILNWRKALNPWQNT